MVAPKNVVSTFPQPQGSGWFISTDDGNAAKSLDINGLSIAVGPVGVGKSVLAMARRWAQKSYQQGQTAEDLIRAMARAHKGMLGGAKGLRLNLADEQEFPALGSCPLYDIKHSAPAPEYWFAMPRNERKHTEKKSKAPTLPKEYVETFSDMSRGSDNNPNPKFLTHLKPDDLDMDENEFEDFMASGLGPKEYKALGKTFRALMRRVDIIKTRAQGFDMARGLQDVAIDAATIAQFCPYVGLPHSFGERLWAMFTDSMWHQTYQPKDVIAEAYNNEIIGTTYGADAVRLLRRVNPNLVWNYKGKHTPQEAAKRAERAVITAAQNYLKELGYIEQTDVEDALNALSEDFIEMKYPVSEESDVPESLALEVETSRSTGDESSERCAPQPCSSDSDEGNDGSPAQQSAQFREAVAHTLTAFDKKKRRAEKIEKEKKSKRGGSLIEKQERLERQAAIGEAEGLREFERQRLEEERARKEEEDRYCGFDPKQVLTFRNSQGYMVMRPISTGIKVDEAFARGAHLFGWIADVSSNQVAGTCFISADKLKMVKSKCWPELTEAAKTSLMQSLVGEKWPYMPSLYTGNILKVERKAYDIIYDADGRGETELKPTITHSTYEAVGTVMGKTLFMPDPEYRKEERAFQLLPFDDTHMAALFPICREELEKMIAKRLTSRFKPENWVSNPPPSSPWYRLYGNNTWEVEPGTGVGCERGFFRDYAEKVIEVKTTLSGPEKTQWRSSADAADLMDRVEIISYLKRFIDEQTHGFIKNEIYSKKNTTLRLIISPALFVKIVFGAVIRRIEERLYSNDPTIPITGHHIKHMALADAEEAFVSWQRDDGGKYFETDYSAYESSQNFESLAKEFELYRSYYVQGGLADNILCTVLEKMLSGKVKVRNKHFSIIMPPMRWSGMPNTACGNLLMNYYNLVVNCGLDPDSNFLLEGDDGIMWGPPDLGDRLSERSAFPLTLDSSEDYSRLSFCGLHYCENAHVPADENLAVARLLTYFDTQELSMQKRYELLYMRLVSYQLLYPKWPLLDVILQQAERYYHNITKREISESTIRRWFADQGWWMNQMLGDFKIEDIVRPGHNYAFVHLAYETLDQIRGRSRSRQLARSDAMMDKLVPDLAGPRPNETLRLAQAILAIAGPLAGVALLCSGHKKSAIMAMVTSASVVSALQSLSNLALDEEQPNTGKQASNVIDRVWAAMTQSVVTMFASNRL